MLSYTDIKPGKILEISGELFEVLSTSGVVKKQRQKPRNSVKLKSLKDGKVIEKTFTQADKIKEAELELEQMKFLYSKKDEIYLCKPNNPKERISLSADLLGDKLLFLKEGEILDVFFFEGVVVQVRVPIKVKLKVVEAPPSLRGDTAQGGSKFCVLESGAKISTPLFIKEGDEIIVNTESGTYVERAK